MSNLPWGAEFDPCAPYNERERQYVELDVDVTLTIKKRVSVMATKPYYGDELNSDEVYNLVMDEVNIPDDWTIEDVDLDY